jgi:2'-5' RNA ligase
MFVDPNGVEYLNTFALVSYIPEPLAGFLDQLRCELVPNCFLRAHVTILPPRSLEAPPEKAWTDLREAAYYLKPIDISLDGVEIFPVSDVIYIAIHGREGLLKMHDTLNVGKLACKEPFPYHPHVTLAQNLKPDQVDELGEVARRRWREYKGNKVLRVETITFVQNTKWHGWVDLAETVLGRGVEREPELVQT